MKPQNVRGTRDLWGDEARLFREIEAQFHHTAKLYDFQEIETPIFEFTSVFKRSLGDGSDIVHKEMYSFEDRSGDSLTLRPEGTACVARALISNGLLREMPRKLFYSGPMFRHERPQKGRYRQFRQFGVELIGVPHPIADIEVIACAWAFFKQTGLEPKVRLEINSIGDESSRQNFKSHLIKYLEDHKNQLSPDSSRRLSQNPLRVLDSKDEGDRKILEKAPELKDHLNGASKDFFEKTLQGLEALKIPYQINPQLVRGLDYYNHTVFEFTTDHLGSQNAVLSGGRYDHLIETMGGGDHPGVGWAAGTDRLALLLEAPQEFQRTVAVISPSNSENPLKDGRLEVLQELRQNHIPAQLIYSGNISKQMKKAQKRGCSHSLVVGGEELDSDLFPLKDLETGEQEKLPLSQVIKRLQADYAP